MTKLKILKCCDDCGIDQEGIKDLQLIEELDAFSNKKIKNVNHLTKLKILNCFYNCGIDQEGIKDLQLIEELYARDNKKIKNVNHLTKLKKINNIIVEGKDNLNEYFKKNEFNLLIIDNINYGVMFRSI